MKNNGLIAPNHFSAWQDQAGRDADMPPPREKPTSDAMVKELYDEDYADRYAQLYLRPWAVKHNLNIKKLSRLFVCCPTRPVRWLDLFCGQAWHFSQFPGLGKKIGVDISKAQLKRAAQQNPDAKFIRDDVLDVELDGRFDLVSSFWAAYCYLKSKSDIARALDRSIDWVDKGGALYFEVLLAEDVRSFNESSFAGKHQFRVVPITPDYHQWEYLDSGGIHRMTSPSVEFFTDRLARCFKVVEAVHDTGFMTHVIARHKLG